MHAGKNMGIMTTLEKNLLQKAAVGPVGVWEPWWSSGR